MASVVQVRPDVYNDPLQPYEKSFKFISNFLMKETQIQAPAWVIHWLADVTLSIINYIKDVA